MQARHLRTDYLKNPLGLGNTKPRFYWQCEGGVRQTAYQIVAAKGKTVVWDSGKVVSSRMTHIPYGGPALQSRDRVQWCVTLWDENDKPGKPASAWFEMGLLQPSDWKAQWMAGDVKTRKKERLPVD